MDVNGALGIIVALLGIATIVGGVIGAVLLRNLSKATLETYKEDNEALRHRVDTLDHERDTLAERVDHLELRVGELAKENELLREIVPGTKAIQSLDEKVDRYHTQMMGQLRLVGGALQDIARAVATGE